MDWLNAVDATYRSDLRELNELNYARFDAKLEPRLGEQTRWFIAMWGVVLVAIIGLWFRR